MGKNFFIILLAGCILIWVIISMKSCERKNIIGQIDRYENNLKDTSYKYVDLYGDEHTRNKQLMMEREVLRHEINDLSQRLDAKEKAIQSFTRISTRTEVSIPITPDTVYKDKYIMLDFSRKDSFKMKLYDTLTVTDYWKRKWFLGRKNYYVDVYNVNPYVKMDRIVGYKINQKQPRFIVGPSMGYNVLNNGYYFGVGIMYYPATLKIKF